MKRFIIIITTAFLLSCTTTNKIDYNPNNYKIWKVNSFNYNHESLIPELIDAGLFIYDEVKSKYYLQLTLSKKELQKQTEYWKSLDKDVDISKLLLQIEINFNKELESYTITETEINYLFSGNNFKIIEERLENIVYSRKINQSRGLIPFLVEMSNPNIEERLPFPIINQGEVFKVKSINNQLVLESENSIIKLDFIGEHTLISSK